MPNCTYDIISYDEESNSKWYATVLQITDQKPVAVYRVPSDPPVYSGLEDYNA